MSIRCPDVSPPALAPRSISQKFRLLLLIVVSLYFVSLLLFAMWRWSKLAGSLARSRRGARLPLAAEAQQIPSCGSYLANSFPFVSYSFLLWLDSYYEGDIPDEVVELLRGMSAEQAPEWKQKSPITAQFLLAVASAAQPAQRNADPEQHNTPVSGQCSSEIHESSAARPASESNAYAEPRSLQDCSDWLNDLTPREITQSSPLKRLQWAAVVLQKCSSRQQRKEVQQLLGPWGVHQRAKNQKRSIDEVKAELLGKVIGETRRLKRMRVASEASGPHVYAGTTGARCSAISVSLQNTTTRRQA
jgi:hypothetical protein